MLNAAARLVYGSRKYDHVTPLLKDLHWLRVPERVVFRLAVLYVPFRPLCGPKNYGPARSVYFNYFPGPARCKPVKVEARPGPARPVHVTYLVQQTLVPEILNTI